MRNFSSPAAFAAFLPTLLLEVAHEEHKLLEKAAKIVETEAKRVIGTYDYNWAPLAASTLERKAADTPLLETGEMRDSIEYAVDGKEAHIFSNNDKALWHELGTSKVPPRPFLSGALENKSEEIVKQIGQGIVRVIEGNKI